MTDIKLGDRVVYGALDEWRVTEVDVIREKVEIRRVLLNGGVSVKDYATLSFADYARLLKFDTDEEFAEIRYMWCMGDLKKFLSSRPLKD